MLIELPWSEKIRPWIPARSLPRTPYGGGNDGKRGAIGMHRLISFDRLRACPALDAGMSGMYGAHIALARGY